MADLSFAAYLNDVASDSSLSAAERIRELREAQAQTTDEDLLGQISTYIASLDAQREGDALGRIVAPLELRENATLRKILIDRGISTPEEMDRIGYFSHEELDRREADGSIEEAIALQEGMGRFGRKALRWAKGFEKGGEFRPTRGGDAGRQVKKPEVKKPEKPKMPDAPGASRGASRKAKAPSAPDEKKDFGEFGPEHEARVAKHTADLTSKSKAATTKSPQSPGTASTHSWKGPDGESKDFKVTKDGSIDVEGDVMAAADLLGQGKKVQLQQPDQVASLLSELAKMNDPEKTYDLCNVSVPGTNLFCAESKGIDRIDMPQLKAKPLPGSRADKEFEKNEDGEVDLNQEFISYLEDKGVKVFDDEAPASHLRATQRQLNGAKVAGMMTGMQEGGRGKSADEVRDVIQNARLLVGRSGYVVDGHHRWAAVVGDDAKDGKMGDQIMPVRRIDMDIIPLLAESLAFCEEYGLPVAGVGQNQQAGKK